jgi:hypothetical protein
MTIHVIKLFFLLVLLLSFPGALKAQSKDYQYRARLRDSVDHAQPDTLKITLLLKLGNDYREENKNKIGLDTALRFVQRALRLARLHGNLLRIGDCYELVSSIYERQNNLIQARNISEYSNWLFFSGQIISRRRAMLTANLGEPMIIKIVRN